MKWLSGEGDKAGKGNLVTQHIQHYERQPRAGKLVKKITRSIYPFLLAGQYFAGYSWAKSFLP